MGTMANELSLGCDCLGQIHYLVCWIVCELTLETDASDSQVHTSPMMGVPSLSRMQSAFMRKMLAFFGNTQITAMEADRILYGDAGW
jgi:hypothetical protein